MVNLKTAITCWLFVFALLQGTGAQATWQFEFMPGIGKALPSPITIQQEGYSRLHFWTSYKTRSLKLPVYYSYRLSRYHHGRGWELEMNHLKLYAVKKPAEVGHFSITHGFNSLWLNRGWDKARFRLKAGAGVVIAHPENTVRGRKLDENQGINSSGYYIGGPTAHIGLQLPLELSKHWFVTIEAKVSAAYAKVPVDGGKAKIPVVALHLLLGSGFLVN